MTSNEQAIRRLAFYLFADKLEHCPFYRCDTCIRKRVKDGTENHEDLWFSIVLPELDEKIVNECGVSRKCSDIWEPADMRDKVIEHITNFLTAKAGDRMKKRKITPEIPITGCDHCINLHMIRKLSYEPDMVSCYKGYTIMSVRPPIKTQRKENEFKLLNKNGYETGGSYAFTNSLILARDHIGELTLYEWAVFSYLVSYLSVEKNNEDGVVFPTVRKISNDLKMGKRLIYRATKGLEKKGFIDIKRIQGNYNFYVIYKIKKGKR